LLTCRSDLGTIKYLKDGDDHDLDPEELVSDLLVNEGKAARDGLDQEAVVKIIQEQGYATRQDSVVPDLTPSHYQDRPRPPVPKFPGLASTLGKRSHGQVSTSSPPHTEKRSKLVEIPESQDEMVPSIEQSPELVHDTQREVEDVDVFDDAPESHYTDKQNTEGIANATLQPITPSNDRLPNGTSHLKSPAAQLASSASKFKNNNKKDTYGLPESDIEDSQMSPRRHFANGADAMRAIEDGAGHTSHQTQSQDPVIAFNAADAPLPMDIDHPELPASQAAPPSAQAKIPNRAAEFSQSEDSASTNNENVPPAQLSVKKGRAATQKKSAPQSEQPIVDIAEVKNPTQPFSRQTSGFVSDIDSPGEQLSQSLWNSAKSQSLSKIDGPLKALSKKQQEKKSKGLAKPIAGPDTQIAAVTNSRRETSAAPRSVAANSAKAKGTRGRQQIPAVLTENTNLGPKKPLQDKMKEAKVGKVAFVEDNQDQSSYDSADESALTGTASKQKEALPSIEKPQTPKVMANSTSRTLPLPQWGSKTDSKDSRSPSFNAQSTLVIPTGMSHEEYLRLRRQNELTPQPLKTPASRRKKAGSSSVSASGRSEEQHKSLSPALSRGSETKTPQAKSELAQNVSAKTQEASSSEEEDSTEVSSSESSDAEPAMKMPVPKAAPSRSASKSKSHSKSQSKSPAELRKDVAAGKLTKPTERAMPPPAPQSTVQRRKSISVSRDRSSSVASSHNSSKKTNSSSGKSTSSDKSRSSGKSRSSESGGRSAKSSSSSVSTSTRSDSVDRPPTTISRKTAATPKTPKTLEQSDGPATSSAVNKARAAQPASTPKLSKLQQLRHQLTSTAASSNSSPGPTQGVAKKSKKVLLMTSSSSESESSTDSNDERAKGKKTVTTPISAIGKVAKRPGRAIRDPSPESSDDSD
jgi:trimeric autotransporter adhesin